MTNKPDTNSALFWSNLVSVIGIIYISISLIIGLVLFFQTDSACDYYGGCSFFDKYPLALVGIAVFFSGLTFGAPMTAVGRYMRVQLEFQNFQHGIDNPAKTTNESNPFIPKYDGTY